HRNGFDGETQTGAFFERKTTTEFSRWFQTDARPGWQRKFEPRRRRGDPDRPDGERGHYQPPRARPRRSADYGQRGVTVAGRRGPLAAGHFRTPGCHWCLGGAFAFPQGLPFASRGQTGRARLEVRTGEIPAAA